MNYTDNSYDAAGSQPAPTDTDPDNDMDADQPMGMGPNEDCVSLKSLSMPDESEQMEAPAVGDTVSYTVMGKVTRIEGDNAYVQKESVNGQEVAEPENEPSDADEFGQLQAQAAQMPAKE